ncbi:PhzF family phenazine biosynthesis protein [Candidatus Gracilibacteria bacterium]|nr:PhzF family phenazine biosynthesis protein [Candidatus Gracilibacteria bacterium]
MKKFTLSAFTKDQQGGNPAGVVLEADDLSNEQMLEIAKEIGHSESAFVLKSDKADFKVRFFTPNQEVDLCGHATMATFSLLASKGIIKPGKYTQETRAGILPVEIKEDLIVLMNQNRPEFLEELDKELVADVLGIPLEGIRSDLPIQIVSTGFPTILVPTNSSKFLKEINPSLEKGIKLCKGKYLLHPFTLETFNPESIALSRDFFPVKDLDEEAATGTATGALSCYLFKYGEVTEEQVSNLSFEQGCLMDRPSEIQVQLSIKDGEIEEVRVGGRSVIL